ncbi:MAG: flagellar basal body P-ring formation chaperone FlgA, partial [Proteobacteria bacterium]|nr:flagellar basal body P-ring formation chaperone FlgA [Pseudomonadota bacterium]
RSSVNEPGKAALPAAILKEHVVVEEKVIRLGDLFENADGKSDTAIAYAPEPGKQVILDARWLSRIAKANGLDWRPLGSKIYAVVERASSTVSFDDIKAQLLTALSEQQGIDQDMDIELATRFQQIFLPSNATATIKIEDLMFTPRTSRFTAVVALTASNQGTQRHRLTGRVIRVLEVPVVDRRVLKDDTITKDNIRWVRMNAERVQRDVVVNADELIGMTPTHGLRAGLPVRSMDVRRPVMVKKNSLVTIYHRVSNMTLTAQGKALSDGSSGDVIQISNARSSHVIEAEVIGPGRVVAHVASIDLAMTPSQ